MQTSRNLVPILTTIGIVLSLPVGLFSADKDPVSKKTYDSKIGKIEVEVIPEKKSLMLGEPIFVTFKIKNLSKEHMFVTQGGDNRNRLGRPDNYKIYAIGPNKKQLDVIDAGMTFGGVMGPRKIDKDSGWSRRLFLPNWFEVNKRGTYVVHCKTKLRISLKPDYTTKPKKGDDDVEVHLSFALDVGQNKMKEMGSLINALGAKSLEGDVDSTKKLLAIRDERVVDHLITMVKMDNYSRRFNALQGLPHFRSDKALSGIEIGLSTKVENLRKNSSNDQVAKQLVKNIRHSSAVALSRSLHPQAEKMLIDLWNDPNEAVRITVLHRLGKMEDIHSLGVLKKMTQDKDERVRNEAVRYYKLRTKKTS